MSLLKELTGSRVSKVRAGKYTPIAKKLADIGDNIFMLWEEYQQFTSTESLIQIEQYVVKRYNKAYQHFLTDLANLSSDRQIPAEESIIAEIVPLVRNYGVGILSNLVKDAEKYYNELAVGFGDLA